MPGACGAKLLHNPHELTLLGDLRGEMATLLAPLWGVVLSASATVMVRGGVTGVLWVRTRPVEHHHQSENQIPAMHKGATKLNAKCNKNFFCKNLSSLSHQCT